MRAARQRKSLALAFITLALSSFCAASTAADRPNILLIIADDLNTDLGSYGHPTVKTPNIDALAKTGTQFDTAHAQYPVCSPSRSSMMTGLYPQQTGVVSNDVHFRDYIPKVTTLPELFKKNGYYSARVGKVYHYNVPGHIGTNGLDDPQSWQEVRNPKGVDVDYGDRVNSVNPRGPVGATLTWLSVNDPDRQHTDAKVTGAALGLLKKNHPQKTGKPFFLSVGYFRPHTPFIAPQRYFDLYPLDTIELPADSAQDRKDIPIAALADRPGQLTMSDRQKREAIQGYYAAISFVDAQIGRLLKGIHDLKLQRDTIVVFLSDHGFHLGRHGLWQKGDLFEGSTRVPLIVSIPKSMDARVVSNQRSDSPVELTDLYPTLAELAGIQAPDFIMGKSLTPLLHDPSARIRDTAYSIARSRAGHTRPEWNYREIFGHSIRTRRYRYTEWGDGLFGVELYDYRKDPEEQHNVVQHRDYLSVKAKLARQLRERQRRAADIEPVEPLFDPVFTAPRQ